MGAGVALLFLTLVALERRPRVALGCAAAGVVLTLGAIDSLAHASEVGAIYVDADTYQRTAAELARCRAIARVPTLPAVPRPASSIWDGFEHLRRGSEAGR